MKRLMKRAVFSAGQRAGIDHTLAKRDDLPPLLRPWESAAGDRRDLPDQLTEKERRNQRDREDKRLGFDHRSDLGAGQFRLSEIKRLGAVVVCRKRREPD